ncbi:hypothetical protein PVL29_012318 [Vitis rotundifolia]|uniref:Uncharacterized protein n=1 Tax=Vitis rotundifolia TaxID=103349 RepID=A0AA39DQN8_VITRO|nr:hypothetical protein PVL29_012318 [Vitis rotundifolia]
MAEKAPSSSSSSTTTSLASSAVGQQINVIGIFREAIKTPARNGKLMLQIMLLVVSPCTLLVLLHHLFVAPLMEKVEDNYKSIHWEDLRALLGIEAPLLVGFWAVSMFGITITIYAAAMTYARRSVSLKDLLSCIQWKKPIITSLYVSFIPVVYAILVIGLIKSINLVTREDAGQAWRGATAVVAALLYIYLTSVSTLGLVVSVMDDECYGAKALEKAVKLSRGRKLQGFFLMLILELLSIPIYILFYVASTDDDDEVGAVTLFSFGFIATVLFCLVNMLSYVVFAVFYSECKKNSGEGIEMGIGPGYSLVPTKLQEKAEA